MKVIEAIHEDGFNFDIGLLYGWICTRFSREEAERKLLSYPSGTRAGWVITEGPVSCEERPGYQHYVVSC